MLSVIIPTRRRWTKLRRTLAAIDVQEASIPGGFEIVVVFDGSEEGTVGDLEGCRLTHPVRPVRQPQAGQAVARNRGAAEAHGDLLLFLDDDVVVAAGFLEAITRSLDEGADVVLTHLLPTGAGHDNLLKRQAEELSIASAIALAAGDFAFDRMLFAATAIRRTWFEHVGGFDESFTADGRYGNEDIDLGHRLLSAGARVAFSAGARAFTDDLTDPDLLLGRAELAGANDVRLARKHPELAVPLFGRKLANSRIHRLVGSLVLRVPRVAQWDAPLRWAVTRIVRSGRGGKIAYRLWLAERAIRYWRGVAQAGGRELVLSLTDGAAQHALPDE